MVDDELFPSGDAGGGQATGKPNGGGGEAATPTPPGPAVVTQDNLDDFARTTVEQMGQISQNQTVLAETLRGVQDALGRLGIGGEGSEGGGGGDEPLDPATFLSDPTGSMRKVASEAVSEALKDQVAPILSMQVETAHTQAIDSLRDEVDTTYGEGVWQKEFMPELSPLIEKTRREAPSQLGNVGAIRRSVDAIKGMKFERLVELKKSHDEKRAQDAEEARAENLKYVTSNLSGGLSRTESGSSLTEEGKEFLSKIYNATGETVDEKDFLATLGSGSTYAEWKASQPKGK